MKILGIDFTSAPCPAKPITVAICELDRKRLQLHELRKLVNFQSFSLMLNSSGPWICAVDFPLGQPRPLIEKLNWPSSWPGYVRHVASLGKGEFRKTLDSLRRRSPAGSKEFFRRADRLAGAISPMKLYGVPVGMMFCEGAPYVLASPASIPPFLPDRDPDRVIIEGYPKLVVSSLVGKVNYKTDNAAKVNARQPEARREILAAMTETSGSAEGLKAYGVSLECPSTLANLCIQDSSGDLLDALLCCLQAAWAYRKRDANFGMPQEVDSLEGWIFDPLLLGAV
jgi:hypothetical protein